jgi:hypothetical protein
MGGAPLGLARATRPIRTPLQPTRDTFPRLCAFAHARLAHSLTGAAALLPKTGV